MEKPERSPAVKAPGPELGPQLGSRRWRQGSFQAPEPAKTPGPDI